MKLYHRSILITLALLSFLLSCAACEAAVICVKWDSPGPTLDGKSWNTAFHTIQAGINAARDGDEVHVAAGTYVEAVIMSFSGKLLGGYSGQGDVRDANMYHTIIDGGKRDTAVSIGTAGDTTVDGFTICNGYHGIVCYNTTVSNNTITGTTEAIYAQYCSPKIIHNYVASNDVGIYLYHATAIIQQNRIIDNLSYGVEVTGALSTAISTIANNCIAGSDKGIYSTSDLLLIANNTIVSNKTGVYGFSSCTIANNIIATNVIGIYAIYNGLIIPIMIHNCMYANVTSNYSLPFNVSPGATDFSADPKLANTAYGDFHLQPDSPCIDAGDSSIAQSGWTDIDGQPRINPSTGVIDVGADEADGTTWTDQPGIIVRVSPSGNDANDGSSWSLAKRTVQAGISAVTGKCGDVWVKAGLYNERINLQPFVGLYGGFAGTETERTARNWQTNPTIIDGQGMGPVVTVSKGQMVNTIDGFTVRNGKGSNGGGIACVDASPIVSNNIIKWNSADSGGGVGGSGGSAPVVINNLITRNVAAANGGGVDGATLVAGNVIVCNGAADGGGVHSINSAVCRLTNNTIVGNAAQRGGAIWCGNGILSNNIVAFNSSGIFCDSARYPYYSPVLSTNCVYGNKVYDYSGLPVGITDIQVDPRLASVACGNMHIQPTSPCRDAGNNGQLQTGWTDMDGDARVQPTDGMVDIGADESDGTAYTVVPSIIRVSPNGNDANDGSSWALARQTPQAAIDAVAEVGGEVWVKSGTYRGLINLRPYANVYGGFTGNETMRAQRDWAHNVTTLNGEGKGCVVTAAKHFAPCTLDGFTILGGNSASGGGISCDTCGPVLANNTITACTATLGGGVYCSFGGPSIIGNIIDGNTSSSDGGGVYDVNSFGTIANNIIRRNNAARGSAVFVWSPTTSVVNNTIVDNSATSGGSVFCNNCAATIRNNIIAFNNNGLYIYTGSGGSTPLLGWNCVYSNTSYNYQGTSKQNTDQASNPLFVDKANGDYRLTATSPCIDKAVSTGAPTVDKDGLIRPQDGNSDGRLYNDIGAYELPGSLTSAKNKVGDGSAVAFSSVSVTAVFPGSVYVEKADRSLGIRVDTTETLSEGQLVNVSGTLQTDLATGERYVLASASYPKPMDSLLPIRPFSLINSVLGAGQLGLQFGVEGGFGVNNIGLLVTTFGSITYAGDGFFYVDDGCALDDGSGHKGVKVLATGLTFPSTGFVKVTGISSCEKNSDGKIVRLLKVRKQEDIVPF